MYADLYSYQKSMHYFHSLSEGAFSINISPHPVVSVCYEKREHLEKKHEHNKHNKHIEHNKYNKHYKHNENCKTHVKHWNCNTDGQNWPPIK